MTQNSRKPIHPQPVAALQHRQLFMEWEIGPTIKTRGEISVDKQFAHKWMCAEDFQSLIDLSQMHHINLSAGFYHVPELKRFEYAHFDKNPQLSASLHQYMEALHSKALLKPPADVSWVGMVVEKDELSALAQKCGVKVDFHAHGRQ